MNAEYVGGYDSSLVVKLQTDTNNTSSDGQMRIRFVDSGVTRFDTVSTTGGYQFRVNNSNVATISVDGNITAVSDASIKRNVTTIGSALDKVSELRGVEYDLTTTGSTSNWCNRSRS